MNFNNFLIIKHFIVRSLAFTNTFYFNLGIKAVIIN